MRHKGMHKLPLALAAIAAACVALSAVATPDWDKEAAQRKAKYVYLEAQSRYAQEEYDDYAILALKAFDLDSTDIDIAAEWGSLMLAPGDADSLTTERAYSYLKRRFVTDPSDYLTGITFANTAKRLIRFDDIVMAWEKLDSAFSNLTQPAEELANAYLIKSVSGDSTAFDKAIAIYDRLESGSGKSPEISQLKVRAYSINKDTAAILREVDDLMASAPNDSYVALFAGANYNMAGDKQRAIELFDLAAQLDSTNGTAYLAKAQLYHEMGDSVAYDREVFHALKSPNLDVDTKVAILRNYVSALYTDPAQEPRIRELFAELEQMHTGEPEIHNLYSAYLFEIGDLKGSAEQLTYSVALDPSDDLAWSSLVQTLINAGDTLGTIKYASQAMERFPDNLYYPMVAANEYRMLDQIDQALQIMDQVKIDEVVNHRAVSSFIAFKGDLLAANHDTIAALNAYDEAIELNPDNSLALNNAAYYMAENDLNLEKAERYAAKAVRNESENPTYLDTYAWVFFKKGEYSLARQYIDMTMRLYMAENPDSAATEIEVDIEPVKVGSQTAEEVTETAPSSEIYEHAGDIYYMDGEHEQAVAYWQKALAIEPDNKILARKVKEKKYISK